MPAPPSLDIRSRFQRCIEDGLSGREAARRLMISPTTCARLWGVLAPSGTMMSAALLCGTNVGGTGQVEIGAGVSASILVGGGGNSITLQPLSVSGMLGAGAALDISALDLFTPEECSIYLRHAGCVPT